VKANFSIFQDISDSRQRPDGKPLPFSGPQENAMTDTITTHSVTMHQPSRVGLQFPNLGIGQAYESLCLAIIDAFAMVYVTPFSTLPHQPPIVLDEDLEGRDPNW
jgi:hypothetical protein